AASSCVRPLMGRTLIHSGGNSQWQVNVPDVWMVLEDWRHTSDFKLHMSTPYVEAFMAKVPELCVEDVEICGYQQRSPQA
ncbi:hypothetical protein ABVB70_25010, partial [Agrobacterium radiobacter]